MDLPRQRRMHSAAVGRALAVHFAEEHHFDDLLAKYALPH